MDRQDWVDLAWWVCFAGAFVMGLLIVSGVARLLLVALSR